MFESRKYR